MTLTLSTTGKNLFAYLINGDQSTYGPALYAPGGGNNGAWGQAGTGTATDSDLQSPYGSKVKCSAVTVNTSEHSIRCDYTISATSTVALTEFALYNYNGSTYRYVAYDNRGAINLISGESVNVQMKFTFASLKCEAKYVVRRLGGWVEYV